MIPTIIATKDGRCEYFYDWLRIFVQVKCNCLQNIDLYNGNRSDIPCFNFAKARDLTEFLHKRDKFVHDLPPLIAPDAGPAISTPNDIAIIRYSHHAELLNLLRTHYSVQSALEDQATNILGFIFKNSLKIKNVNTIIGLLSLAEQRKLRDEFKYQFGCSMRKWLTIQKLKEILRKMSLRSETGQYLSLAKECGFESHAALANFLRLHVKKNLLTIEEEVKGIEKNGLMEKIKTLGLL